MFENSVSKPGKSNDIRWIEHDIALNRLFFWIMTLLLLVYNPSLIQIHMIWSKMKQPVKICSLFFIWPYILIF